MKYLSVDVFIYSLPGGCSGQLIRGVENPAGGEGICGASVGHTLPWEKNWRRKEGKEKKKRGRFLVLTQNRPNTTRQKKC